MSSGHNSPLEVLVATGNEGKVREIREALQDLPFRIRDLTEFSNITQPDETGTTYEENAVLKALSYSSQTGLHALADDSGLEVDAIGGHPGTHSNRFFGPGLSDAQRVEKLLGLLADTPTELRSARFISSMAFAGPATGTQGDSTVIHISRGVCEGSIIRTPLGTNGFGYDPVFLPSGFDKTFGQLPAEVKAIISHRAKALAEMREFLKVFGTQT